MANKRMFSKAILQSTKYLKMPHSAQLLYIQLCIDADDEGLVEAFKIMSMIRCSDDDLKILLDKQFIYILNADLLVFIVDWENHNTIRSDRKCLSIYHEELQKYLTNSIGCQMSGRCQADVSHLPDKCPHSIVEYSREEESIEEGKCQADDIPEKEQEQKSANAKALIFDFSSFTDNEQISINNWFDYKKQIKKQYKTQSGMNTLCNNLKKYKVDGHDIVAIIDNSIMNEYVGIFAPKFRNNANREPDKSTNLKAWLKWKYKDNDEDKKWWWWENLKGDNIRIQGRFIKERYEEACDYLSTEHCDKYVEAYDKGHKTMFKDGTSI